MKIPVRRFLTFALSMTAVLAAVFAVTPACLAQEHKAINVAGNRNLPFSDGVVAGNTLYVAGQEGTDERSKLVAGGIAAETKAALDNIQKVVKAAGFELKDIVSVTVYLADIHEFGDMNKVYREFLPDPKPARATIQAVALVNTPGLRFPQLQLNKNKLPVRENRARATKTRSPSSAVAAEFAASRRNHAAQNCTPGLCTQPGSAEWRCQRSRP